MLARQMVILVLACLLMADMCAADRHGLTPVPQWHNPAEGVWKAVIGDMSREIRYTDLAAERPREEAIEELPDAAFPFRADEIVYQVVGNRIVVRIPAASDEKLYGFGLQFDGLRKTGEVLNLNVDHWGTGGGRTHAPVPFYISSKGYGVFFNTARFLKVYSAIGNRKGSPGNPPPVDRNPPAGEEQAGRWMARPASDALEACVISQGLELFVFSGPSMLDVVRRYNLYCGGGALPPLWGLGFWHRVHAAFDAQQTEREVADFAARNFPLDVIGLEPGWMSKSYPCTFEWQKKRFADPAAFAQGLLDKGIRLNLWVNPYMSPEAGLYEKMYPLSGSHLVWLGLVPDFTLPEARRLLTDQHYEEHVRIGVSGYKVDEVDGYDVWLWPEHATFPSGTSAEVMRQSYGLQIQHMLYHELFKKHNQRTYGNVRASNGAASGYPFVIYSDAYNHTQYITGISTASLCGVLWTPEVRSAGNGREWLNRMQTVCFSSMAKLNAWSSGRKPWDFPEVSDAVRGVIQLRMQLLPYLYTAFADYHFKGIPPMRAMILEPGAGLRETLIEGALDGEVNPYATDRLVEATDQFMFGPSIMVAPFHGQEATTRKVQLPPGAWYDFYSGRYVGSDTVVTVTAEELGDRIALFVRGGSLIPMLAHPVNTTEAAYGADLELRYYGSGETSFDLYEDDGKTFDYETGNYRIRRLTVAEGVLTESLVKGDGPAMWGQATLRKMSD